MPDLCVIDWRVHPMRAERWYETWRPTAERALAFGASSYALTRSVDDPLHFRQTSVWERHEDFERYWASDEVASAREEVMNLYNKPVVQTWHSLLAQG